MNSELSVVLVQLALGGSLPPAIDMLNKYVPDSKVRFWITLLICLTIGTVLHHASLKFSTIPDILMSFGLILSGSQTVYKSLYDGSDLQNHIRTIQKPKQGVAVR